MINAFQTIILALIQGVTEFLPVSSSAHLIFIPQLLQWPDQGLFIDVVVHFGTLGAVVGYFFQDVRALFMGGVSLMTGKFTSGGRLLLIMMVATIPVVIAGFLMVQIVQMHNLRQAALIGLTSIIFGLILWFCDNRGNTIKDMKHLNFKNALFIGCAQVFALVPGVSRSGICVTAMRALGFNRAACVHFSCLLSIPTIIAATSLMVLKLVTTSDMRLTQDALLAVIVSFLVGWISIRAIFKWVKTFNFDIFVVYRVILGLGLLLWCYYSK